MAQFQQSVYFLLVIAYVALKSTIFLHCVGKLFKLRYQVVELHGNSVAVQRELYGSDAAVPLAHSIVACPFYRADNQQFRCVETVDSNISGKVQHLVSRGSRLIL